MKINGPDLTGRLKDLLQRLRSDESEETRGTSPAAAGETGRASGDRVDLSDRARELRILSESLDSDPGVRRVLVESLREEISSGRYAPDGRRIAERLLAEIESEEVDRSEAGEDDDLER